MKTLAEVIEYAEAHNAQMGERALGKDEMVAIVAYLKELKKTKKQIKKINKILGLWSLELKVEKIRAGK